MAASTSYSTAADSKNSYCSYDVFINHRGPDVKKTFASHLYRRLISHGLTAFLDQDELQAGRNFDSQIKEAIRTASIHVAIFSRTYAESEWCMKELELMLKSGATIIPVFHHVKPAEVRWTRGEGVYAQALRILERKRTHDSQPRYSTSTIDNWRNALSCVADLSGLDLEKFGGDEGELLERIVEVVLKKVVKEQLSVAKYPTGLHEKVSDLERRVLSKPHNGRVGITGLGGVGKTTLAKEIFNRKLRTLDVSECSELEELAGVEYLSSLTDLQASKCVKLKSIRCSAQLTVLLSLNVSGCSELEELAGVEHLRSLRYFWASECVKLKSIRCSPQLTRLRMLDVSGCSELEELAGVEYLSSLTDLQASKCLKLKSIRCSAQLTVLLSLNVSGCSELEKLAGVEHLRSLRYFWASECVKLKSIQGLGQLTELLRGDVFGSSELEEH